MFKNAVHLAAGLTLIIVTGVANATPCTGISLGTSSTSNVTLGGTASDQCVISGVNPQQGPNGNTSGFDGTFGGGWSLLGKVTSNSGSNSLGGVNFTWTFAQTTGTTGTWSLTTDKNAMFDLVFAMHASNHSGAFLFDNELTTAAVVDPGTWTIRWLNNGQQVPDFSNLTLFARNVAVRAVPEPGSSALVLAALAAMTLASRRKRWVKRQ